MLTPDDARLRILALATRAPIEAVALIDAAGRWSADTVVARRTQPARDLSVMDGYAIGLSNLPEPRTGPWTVIGESAAGAPFDGTVCAGEAVRISTGAAVPADCDTVVMQEETSRNGDQLVLTGAAPLTVGGAIRRAGSDFTEGDILVERGQALNPATIALAAMGGHGTLAVHRRPRIAILSTGDELVPPGIDPGSSRLPGSNGVMVSAMLKNWPVEVVDLGIVRDDADAIGRALAAAREFDVLVTSGGVSVGDHDLVRPALVGAGAVIDFWRVAMRPGGPMTAGMLGETIVLGLPGNPASAFVTATLFLLPLVRHILGASQCDPSSISGIVSTAMAAVGPRTEYSRARLIRGMIEPLPSSDSGVVRPLAISELLIVRAAGSPALAAGESVVAIVLPA